MLISGLISYFEEEEMKSDASIEHIEKRLELKLTTFRYGTLSFREKAKVAHAKKKKSVKELELLDKLKSYNDRYDLHSRFTADIWQKLVPLLKDDKFSINYLVIALLQKDPNTKSYFGFKDEALRAFGGADASSEHGYAFSSLKVANKILLVVEEESRLLEQSAL